MAKRRQRLVGYFHRCSWVNKTGVDWPFLMEQVLPKNHDIKKYTHDLHSIILLFICVIVFNILFTESH